MILLIAIAGGVGATLRYLVDQLCAFWFGRQFPWGTTVVNLTGSFALGLATGAALGHPAHALLATGLLGGYTTFSTASLESLELLGRGQYFAALLQGPGQLLAGATLATIGLLI